MNTKKPQNANDSGATLSTDNPFWLKNIEESAQAETNIRGGKVDTCKSHVREAMVNMEPFVQENDANRGTYVNE